MVTAALNRFPPEHRLTACITDLARGLRAGAFDLVAANTPWVPCGSDVSQRRLSVNGGPTGFELPKRFLAEGAALLLPGGVMVALAADVTFTNGRSPLQDLCAQLQVAGFTTAVVPTRLGSGGAHMERVTFSGVAGAVAAEHVAVVVAREPVPAGLLDAVAEMAKVWAALEAV